MKAKIVQWLQDNIDFAFVLAAFTETPRWTVAFKAIHEPTWIGVPLGVLLAFATAKAWRRYFETGNMRLFYFNLASMAIAVAVIAPVLYAMTGQEVAQVTLAHMQPFGRGVWSALLAVTTFLPLVQLAAVTDTRMHKSVVQKPKSVVQEIVQPEVQSALAQQTEDVQVASDLVAQVKLLKSEGLSNAKIGQQLGMHRNTVGRMLKEGA